MKNLNVKKIKITNFTKKLKRKSNKYSRTTNNKYKKIKINLLKILL